MQYLIADQSYDSRIINIAGRQRMLSQKITKTSLYIASRVAAPGDHSYHDQLRESLDLWVRSHQGLLNGDSELGLSGKNSDEILALFQQIDPYFVAIVDAASKVLNPATDRAGLQREIQTIGLQEPDFLKLMNEIVFMYDREATDKVEFARVLELCLMSITLLVLLLEARFIFSPATRRISVGMQLLAEREKELEQLFRVSPTAMLLVDSGSLSILKVNDKAVQLLGFSGKEIVTHSLHDYIASEYESNRVFWDKIKWSESLHEFEVVLFGAQRAIYETLVSVRKIRFSGRSVLVLGITNITELKKAQEKMAYYASYDELTGLVNRRTGLMLLDKAMARSRRDKVPLIVCFADIDGLKAANDRCGHAEGDWIICAVSTVLTENIRSSDTAIRMGGDEFLLILEDCREAELSVITGRIEQGLQRVREQEDKDYSISMSVGSMTYDAARHPDAGALISEADQQMYRTKVVKKAQ